MAVDLVIFTMALRRDSELQVLLIRRKYKTFQGFWALPGGFVGEDESLEAAASRELREETGVQDVYVEQLYTFGDPDRDPRGRVVSVAYFALISADRPLTATTDASDVRWFPLHQVPELAFDHRRILDCALERLRNKLEYTTVGFQLLPAEFTLSELQGVYEAILGKKLDKRNFRRKIELLDVVRPLEKWRREGVTRPARLYQFVSPGHLA